tara:strand:- start:2609 stop:4693 length:2085 start_codon:yes stop_codon:yes gene_type:complete
LIILSNRLSEENSPYLLQHSNNPVNWYPWCDEAFKLAEEKDLPVFLSIGYSTCHWCHVMERECFEDDEVAKILNSNFISIKVDREQRPDIDSIYMSVCQMMTQRGGWPLSIFITPKKEPFFAGTYFPKNGKDKMVGFVDLLNNIINVWNNNKPDIFKSAESIIKSLKDISNPKLPNSFIKKDNMKEIFESLKDFYDEKYGGFGEAPKFPSPQNIIFLAKYFSSFKDNDSLRMINQTLTSIALGGIHDHLGGGFHRYSTDVKWLVPHFEKMLYDQANILEALYEGYLLDDKDIYLETINSTQNYLNEIMKSDSGAFFSAEDADSEGEEGLFYIWSEGELKEVLKSDEFYFFKHLYNIEPQGNFLEETTKQENGKNIIYLKDELEKFSSIFSLEENLIKEESKRIKSKLKNYRNKRKRPILDDKILTDWNSMVISSLSKISRIKNNHQSLDTAIRCNEFIENNMINNGDLNHCYRNNVSSINGTLDDYSFYSKALIDLYESTLDPNYLIKAYKISERMIFYFWDHKNGLFFSSRDDDDLIVRQKNLLDGASPSGNSIALYALAKLSYYFNDEDLKNKATELSSRLGEMAKKFPINLGMFLSNQFLLYDDTTQIIITSNWEHLDHSNEVVNYLINYSRPNKTLFHINSDSQRRIFLEISKSHDFLPEFSKDLNVYICSDYQCNLPVKDLSEIKKILE